MCCLYFKGSDCMVRIYRGAISPIWQRSNTTHYLSQHLTTSKYLPVSFDMASMSGRINSNHTPAL